MRLDIRYIYERLYDLFDIYDIEVELGKELVGFSTVTVPIRVDIRKADIIPKLAKSKIALYLGLSDKDIMLTQGRGCYNLILNTEPQGELLLSDLLTRLEGEHKEIYSNALSLLVGINNFNALITLELGNRNPHVIIAGSSGSGKTTLLSNTISQVLERDIESKINLICYTPKADLNAFNTSLNYEVIHSITDIETVLQDVNNEMVRREKVAGRYNPMLIILDEVNSLLSVSDVSKGYIEQIAMRGRSSGIHLILSMQSAKKENLSKSPILRENCTSRAVFKVDSKRESNTLSNRVEINCVNLRIGECYLITSRGFVRCNIPLDDISSSYTGAYERDTKLELIKGGLQKVTVTPNWAERTEERDTSELRDIEKFKALPEEVRNYITSKEGLSKGISKSILINELNQSQPKALEILKSLEDLRLLGDKIAMNQPSPIIEARVTELLSFLDRLGAGYPHEVTR